MTDVRKVVSVHPRTITEFSTGDAQVTRRRRSVSRIAQPLTYTKVDADVWLLAMHAANGDPSRIQVIGPDTVIVHNNSNWKRK